jgi:hypothetical protein
MGFGLHWDDDLHEFGILFIDRAGNIQLMRPLLHINDGG